VTHDSAFEGVKTSSVLDVSSAPLVCARCRTELAPQALSCPACAALVHADRLKALAGLADAATAAGDHEAARRHWMDARLLVPAGSQQDQAIGARLGALPDPLGRGSTAGPSPSTAPGSTRRGWWTPVLGGAVTVGLLLAGKLKFLLLGLTKLGTVFSMFGFIAVYWSIHGWPLAVGIAASIYVHEMGHVAMLRRLGIHAGAPLFIPGVGALVMLRERVTDAVTDARIGLAGPVWGLGAAVAAAAMYLATGRPTWWAIAELTGFINLFNLIPVWQLDGSRGFHALSRGERWAVVAVIGLALWATGVGLLWFVGAVAVYRAIATVPGPGHTPSLATFAGLVIALSWFARSVQ
jgi:Zn-dependent protease